MPRSGPTARVPITNTRGIFFLIIIIIIIVIIIKKKWGLARFIFYNNDDSYINDKTKQGVVLKKRSVFGSGHVPCGPKTVRLSQPIKPALVSVS